MNARNINADTGKPYTIDEIAGKYRDRRTLKQQALDQQRANDIEVLKSAAQHKMNLSRHPCPDPLAVKLAGERLEQAARPFGGIEAARAAGVIP